VKIKPYISVKADSTIKAQIISDVHAIKELKMNMDDTFLRRYIKNLSIKIKYRQS
jgi:hypothetical protein